MSKAGQNNYKGINSQAKASIYLFLKYLKDPNFSHVVLEDEDWEDFTLVFKNEKKIICESKDWTRSLSYRTIQQILENILKSKKTVAKQDEILIIANKVKKQILDNLQDIFWVDTISKFKNNHFSNSQISLLNRLHFYEIIDIDIDLEIEKLFYDQIEFWIPSFEIERLINDILVQKIYNKSEKGGMFSKKDFYIYIENFKKEKIANLGTYDSKKRAIEIQIHDILKAIENADNKYLIKGDHLTSLTAQPELMYYTLNKIEKKEKIDLKKWDFLFPALLKKNYIYTLLRIFENNIERNSDFILEFMMNNYSHIPDIFRERLYKEKALRIIKKIVKFNSNYHIKAFNFLKDLLKVRSSEFNNIDQRRHYQNERKLISEILFELYYNTPDTNSLFLYEIVDIIFNNYNLIEDDLDYFFSTDIEIYNIIKQFLLIDFKKNLPKIIYNILEQYQKSYEKNYNGWEGIGSGISQSGNEFTISEKSFVLQILKPAFLKFYNEDNDTAWQYIKKNCLSLSKNVSKKKPDFINRSIIKIILIKADQNNGTISNEILEILEDFLFSRRGIPHKADLIFEELYNNNYSDSLKLKIISITFEKYSLPINIFVEKLLAYLVKKNSFKAKKLLKIWINNDEYYNFWFI